MRLVKGRELNYGGIFQSFRMNSDDDSYFINMDRDFVVLLQEDFNVSVTRYIRAYLKTVCHNCGTHCKYNQLFWSSGSLNIARQLKLQT